MAWELKHFQRYLGYVAAFSFPFSCTVCALKNLCCQKFDFEEEGVTPVGQETSGKQRLIHFVIVSGSGTRLVTLDFQILIFYLQLPEQPGPIA